MKKTPFKKHRQCCSDLATKGQKKTGQALNNPEKAFRERERGRAEGDKMTIMRVMTASARERDRWRAVLNGLRCLAGNDEEWPTPSERTNK